MSRVYRKRKKGGKLLFTFTTVLLMLLAVLIGLSAFFTVSNVEVTGISLYTADQIIQASGIQKGDNLVFIRDSDVVLKIKSQYDYVDKVRIVREFPDTILIDVNESYPIAHVTVGEAIWLIDENCKCLESVESSDDKVLTSIEIRGVNAETPVKGQALSVADDTTQIQCLSDVLTALQSAGINGNVTYLDVENIGNLIFDYNGIYKVELGAATDLDAKLKLLEQVLTKLDGKTAGTIAFASGSEAHFIPD